jgi:hypothetical protein
MESKLKNLTITIGECKKVPDIVVLMGIVYDVSPAAIMKLDESFSWDNLKSDNCLFTNSEQSALAYALYHTIRNKMVGSPLELSKSRVSRIECYAHDGKFLISWNTQGSLSALRKTLSIVLSSINPHKLFSKYSTNIKNLGGKVDRDEFNYVANQMVDSIKKSISIAVVGRIKMDLPKIKDLLDRINKKQPTLSHEKGLKKPGEHDKFTHNFPSIKASGISSAVTEDYIRSSGMGTTSINGEIIIYNKSFESKKESLKQKDKIKKYVQQKYEKLGKDFPCVFAYLCMTQKLCSCCSATSIIKNKPSATSMVDLIYKTL